MKCAKRVFSGERSDFSGHMCGTTATVEEDGKWWCKRHAPSRVAQVNAVANDWSARLQGAQHNLGETHATLSKYRKGFEAQLRAGEMDASAAYRRALLAYDAALQLFVAVMDAATAAKFRGVGYYRKSLQWYR